MQAVGIPFSLLGPLFSPPPRGCAEEVEADTRRAGAPGVVGVEACVPGYPCAVCAGPAWAGWGLGPAVTVV